MLIHRKSPGKHWISNFFLRSFVAISHKQFLREENLHRRFPNGYKMQIFMRLLSVQITTKFVVRIWINLESIIHIGNTLISIHTAMLKGDEGANQLDLWLNWIVSVLLILQEFLFFNQDFKIIKFSKNFLSNNFRSKRNWNCFHYFSRLLNFLFSKPNGCSQSRKNVFINSHFKLNASVEKWNEKKNKNPLNKTFYYVHETS